MMPRRWRRLTKLVLTWRVSDATVASSAFCCSGVISLRRCCFTMAAGRAAGAGVAEHSGRRPPQARRARAQPAAAPAAAGSAASHRGARDAKPERFVETSFLVPRTTRALC